MVFQLVAEVGEVFLVPAGFTMSIFGCIAIGVVLMTVCALILPLMPRTVEPVRVYRGCNGEE